LGICIGQLEATRDLVKGTEINLEELPSRAVQSLILKVKPPIAQLSLEIAFVTFLQCSIVSAVTKLPLLMFLFLFVQYYKITPAEVEVSSLEEAVTCRVAARDIL